MRQYLAYRRFLTFFNFHSLRISVIYVSVLAFCQVLLNEYDDDDDDDDMCMSVMRNLVYNPQSCSRDTESQIRRNKGSKMFLKNAKNPKT